MPVATLRSDPLFVRKLTATPVHRQETAALRQATAIVAIMLALLLVCPADSRASAPQWQPVEDIVATAEAYLDSRTGAFSGDTSVQAAGLDSRHRLPYCDEPLQAFMRAGAEIQARTIVGVRCTGRKPWKVYVPVDVVVMATVMVARQTLLKGQVLNAADLAAEQRDVSRLRSGFITDPKQVIGQRLKTQLIAGKLLKPSMLAADIAVRRGQTVTLTVNAGSFDIRMSGTALMDGVLQQRIRVQNNSSGRIVEGIVRSREVVEIMVSNNQHFSNAEHKVSPISADTKLSNNDR